MTREEVLLKILGDSAGGEKALSNIGRKMDDTKAKAATLSGHFSNLKTTLLGLGAGFAAAFAFKEVISETTEFGASVKGIQRMLGDTAEDASLWAYAAKRFGVESATMGMSVKTLAKDVANGGEKLASYGIAARDAQGNVRPFTDIMADVADKATELGPGLETDAMATDLFGRGAMNLLPVLLKGGDGIRGMADQAQEAGMIMSQEGVDSVTAYRMSVKDLTEKLDGLKIKIGLELMPWLMRFANVLTDNLVPAVIIAGSIIGIVTTMMAINFAVKTAASIRAIWSLIRAVGALDLAMKAVGFTSLGSSMETLAIQALIAQDAIIAFAGTTAGIVSIVAIIIAGIAALAAGLDYVFNNWSEMPWWIKVWAVFVSVVNPVSAIIAGIIALIRNWGSVAGAVTGPIVAAWDAISGAARAMWDGITAGFNTFIGWITGLPGQLATLASGILSAVVSGIQQLPYVIGYIIGYAAGTIALQLYNIVTTIWSILSAIPGIVSGIFWGAVNAIGSALQAAYNWVAAIIPQIPGIVWNGLMSLPGIASGAFWGVVNVAWAALSGLVGAVASSIGSAVGVMAGLPGQLLGAIGDLSGLLWGAGVQLIQGLINGISSMSGAAFDAIRGLAGGLKDGFLQAIGAASPSRVFMAAAEYIPQGVAQGVYNATGLAVSSVRSMADAMAGVPLGGLSPSMALSGGGSAAGIGGGNTYIFNINSSASDPRLAGEEMYRMVMAKMERDIRSNS